MLRLGIAYLAGFCSLLIIENHRQAEYLCIFSCLYFIFLFVYSKLFSNKLSCARKIYFDLLRSAACKIFISGLLLSSAAVLFWKYYSGQLLQAPRKTVALGYVCSIPHLQSEYRKFDFCITELEGKKVGFAVRSKFQLGWGAYSEPPSEEIKAGQFWSLELKLRPVHGRYNPGGFDSEKWLVAQGYAGKGSVRGGKKISLKPSLSSSYHGFRQHIFEKISRASQKSENLGLILAITLGEKSYISDAQWESFRQSGTSHLLAISGLHIGIAALWSYWLFSLLWRASSRLCTWLPAQIAGQIMSLCGAAFLLSMSGFGLPGQRAFVMLSVFIMASWSSRHFKLGNVLGLAIIIVLTLHPFAILSTGFWLSFIAVFIISCVIQRQSLPTRKLQGYIIVNWYLFIGLVPISISVFGFYSFASLVANLILIPFTSFVLTPVTYLGLVLALVWESAAVLVLAVSSFLMDFVIFTQSLVNAASFLQVHIDISGIQLVLASLIGLVLLVPQKIISKIVILPLTLIFIGVHESKPEQSLLEMAVFDIGQGLSVYLETEKGNVLFDTGWGNENYATAQSSVLPFLKVRGVTGIDKFIVSHADSDHAGGVKQIVENLAVNSIIKGEKLRPWAEKIVKSRQLPSTLCSEDASWSWGNVSFNFMEHLGWPERIGNNASCVLYIKAGDKKILITGDIEEKAERALLKQLGDAMDVVVAPHHGSKTSSTQAFVDQFRPRHVIFSTGYDNQWHFPRKEVVLRYIERGSQVWTTHVDGALLVSVSPDSGLKVNSWRQLNQHFWLNP
ncbi:DNA internalization-related competence protein ComEC/Rec2 [Aliikangiella sp. G2MR2-5]|uniref:DNA internalization-related competence protein ComEC/Rec2 n=1 Tax=Aliikangiella sp. G2MR2-5 TaxID=2788943 RepID=UPI0018AA4D95|nr:DNA internalization-related competence protein ComEC/Rec2 [Aliikangiella sp. G2MR2-5]